MNRNFKVTGLMPVFFVLFCHSAFPQPGKSFGEYKTEIINLGNMKKFDETLRLLEEAKREFPEEKKFQASIYYHTAYGYYSEGEVGKALSILEKSTQEYPSENKILALYSRTLIKNNRKEEALEILEKFPKNLGTFEEDLKKAFLDIWTTYNLAASYALLGNTDLAVLCLSTLFSVKDYDPKVSFSHVEEDPDFDSLRGEQRYEFLIGMALAEDFDDAVAKLEKELELAREIVGNLYARSTFPDESLRFLQESLKTIERIYTVAPILIRIQRVFTDYLQKAIEKASADHLDEKSSDYFEKRYQYIKNKLHQAKASQQTHRDE